MLKLPQYHTLVAMTLTFALRSDLCAVLWRYDQAILAGGSVW